MNVSIEGVAAARVNFDRVVANIQSTNANTVKTAAFDLVSQTKTQITINESVITGTLRRSVHAEKVNELEWVVGPDVEYDACVEARNPYLQPSLDVIAARYPNLVISGIQGVL